MTTKKTRSIHKSTTQDSAFINASDFAILGLDPSEFEGAIASFRGWHECGDAEILELFLQHFEREAKAHSAGKENEPKSIHDTAAIQITLSAAKLRYCIKAKDAVAASLETMRLCFAGVALGLHDFAMTGIRAKQGRKAGGKRTVDNAGFLAAVEHVLPRLKRPSARTVWNYLQRHHNGEENALDLGRHTVFFYDDRLFQADETGKTRNISFATFRTHLF